jgi:hypothetical protein
MFVFVCVDYVCVRVFACVCVCAQSREHFEPLCPNLTVHHCQHTRSGHSCRGTRMPSDAHGSDCDGGGSDYDDGARISSDAHARGALHAQFNSYQPGDSCRGNFFQKNILSLLLLLLLLLLLNLLGLLFFFCCRFGFIVIVIIYFFT